MSPSSNEPFLELNDVSFWYEGAKEASVKEVSFSLYEGEIFVIVGSSGSGKSTLLKMVLGLLNPTLGSIFCKKMPFHELSKKEKRSLIGYVFQGMGLFPHLTVEENITLPLKLNNVSKQEYECRGEELLKLIKLEPALFKSRYPDQLSGGQKQRVAVARALATNPKLLLLDEPFGSLDAIHRHQIQLEIKRLHNDLKKTVLFVTHDIIEAMILGSRIGIMHAGRMHQIGTKEELIKQPKTAFVEKLMNEMKETFEWEKKHL